MDVAAQTESSVSPRRTSTKGFLDLYAEWVNPVPHIFLPTVKHFSASSIFRGADTRVAKKFIDDKVEHIVSDIEKVQTKSSMYISYLGSRGALHLCKELINNAIDECINPNSPAENISIYMDEIDNSVTVGDDGRGIKFEDVETVCSYLQAGSKFERLKGARAGENGEFPPTILAIV